MKPGEAQGSTINANIGRNKKITYREKRDRLEGAQQLETTSICSSIYSMQRKCLAVLSLTWEYSLFISSRQLHGFMKAIFDSYVFTVLSNLKYTLSSWEINAECIASWRLA